MHYTQLSRRGGCWSAYRNHAPAAARDRSRPPAARPPCHLPPPRPAHAKLLPFLLLLIVAVLCNLILPAA
jgi:hypothetical protein